MKTERTGIILCTQHYDACVEFYAKTLGLKVIEVLDNEHSKLTILEYGRDTYLMIETGGDAVEGAKSMRQSPVILRFNVADVDESAAQLSAKNVDLRIRREVWGTVADFVDPDGNRCSLREEKTFGE